MDKPTFALLLLLSLMSIGFYAWVGSRTNTIAQNQARQMEAIQGLVNQNKVKFRSGPNGVQLPNGLPEWK